MIDIVREEALYSELLHVIKDNYYDVIFDDFEINRMYLSPVFGNFLRVLELSELTKNHTQNVTRTAPPSQPVETDVTGTSMCQVEEAVLNTVHENISILEEFSKHFAIGFMPIMAQAPARLEPILAQAVHSLPIFRWLRTQTLHLPPYDLLPGLSSSTQMFIIAMSIPASRLAWYTYLALSHQSHQAFDFHVVSLRVAKDTHDALRRVVMDALNARVLGIGQLPRNEHREVLFDTKVTKLAKGGRKQRHVYLCTDVIFYCEILRDGNHRLRDFVHFSTTSSVRISLPVESVPKQIIHALAIEHEKKKLVFLFDNVHERDHFAQLANQVQRNKGCHGGQYRDIENSVPSSKMFLESTNETSSQAVRMSAHTLNGAPQPSGLNVRSSMRSPISNRDSVSPWNLPQPNGNAVVTNSNDTMETFSDPCNNTPKSSRQQTPNQVSLISDTIHSNKKNTSVDVSEVSRIDYLPTEGIAGGLMSPHNYVSILPPLTIDSTESPLWQSQAHAGIDVFQEPLPANLFSPSNFDRTTNSLPRARPVHNPGSSSTDTADLFTMSPVDIHSAHRFGENRSAAQMPQQQQQQQQQQHTCDTCNDASVVGPGDSGQSTERASDSVPTSEYAHHGSGLNHERPIQPFHAPSTSDLSFLLTSARWRENVTSSYVRSVTEPSHAKKKETTTLQQVAKLLSESSCLEEDENLEEQLKSQHDLGVDSDVHPLGYMQSERFSQEVHFDPTSESMKVPFERMT